jgi:radical SAM superfamily enzyme YgiQ (UPF0313 family)
MSSPFVVGHFQSALSRSILAALHKDSTTFGLDGAHSLSFDRDGRLLRVFWEARSIRRSLDNRFIEKRRVGDYPSSPARRELDLSESRGLCEAILREVSTIEAALASPAANVPKVQAVDLRARLKDILGWNLEAMQADAAKFRSTYLLIPILPPDQYGALVIQLTEGCSYNKCMFCRFYRDRAFWANFSEELRTHIQAVRAFFGKSLQLRRSVFLADANAPVPAFSRLLNAFEILREELPLRASRLRGVYSFIDAFSGPPKSIAEFQELVAAGLRRVYFGLESGCDDLLRFLNTPATSAEALKLVHTLKSARVEVGVILLDGIGGDSFAGRHVEESLAAVNAMNLGPQDILYLSPLAADSGSPYRQQEHATGIRPLAEGEMDA